MATLDTRQRQDYDHLKARGFEEDHIYKQLGVENPNAPKLSDVLKPAVKPVTATPPPAAPAPAPVLDPTPAPIQATPALSSIQAPPPMAPAPKTFQQGNRLFDITGSVLPG